MPIRSLQKLYPAEVWKELVTSDRDLLASFTDVCKITNQDQVEAARLIIRAQPVISFADKTGLILRIKRRDQVAALESYLKASQPLGQNRRAILAGRGYIP